MTIFRDIAVGVAASAAFALIQRTYFPLSPTATIASLVLVFVIAAGLAMFLGKRAPDAQEKGEGTSIASDNETDGQAKLDVKDVDVKGSGDVSIGSGNKSKGDMTVKVERTKVRK